jgi:hypothetical protein
MDCLSTLTPDFCTSDKQAETRDEVRSIEVAVSRGTNFGFHAFEEYGLLLTKEPWSMKNEFARG